MMKDRPTQLHTALESVCCKLKDKTLKTVKMFMVCGVLSLLFVKRETRNVKPESKTCHPEIEQRNIEIRIIFAKSRQI